MCNQLSLMPNVTELYRKVGEKVAVICEGNGSIPYLHWRKEPDVTLDAHFPR